MNSASRRPFSAPVAGPQSGAGRHRRPAVEQRNSCCQRIGSTCVQGPVEPVQQQRAPHFVAPEQPHAAHIHRRTQKGDLVRRNIIAVRDEQHELLTEQDRAQPTFPARRWHRAALIARTLAQL